MKKRIPAAGIAAYALILLIVFFTLFPVFWLLVSAFKPKEEIFTVIPSFMIKNPTLDNIKWALSPSSGDFMPFFVNSIVITVFTIIVTIVLSYFAAYALARYKFRGMAVVFGLLMLSQMFQGPSIMVAWYKMAQFMKIVNTRMVLVLIYCTATIPISTVLLSGFVRSIPKELDEAAMIDGASKIQILARVILPLLTPFLVSVSIYAAIISWNDYQYALILTSSKKASTVQISLANLMSSMGSQNWGGIMATALIITLPVVVFFAVIQKNLITGLTRGAVKG
ncbi:MAG: carbohydrate ABC transporter permease [Treponema sp.]|jgi:ABC-type glycerol-3-phosphate transport system permease component|nr:carbohydrate ABC transporter permease [Treponema sp.]